MLDNAKQKENDKATFEEYFKRIKMLSERKAISSLLRYKLIEVMELRENKWKSRREDEGPLLIEEVHK